MPLSSSRWFHDEPRSGDFMDKANRGEVLASLFGTDAGSSLTSLAAVALGEDNEG